MNQKQDDQIIYQYLSNTVFKDMIKYRTIKLGNITTSNDTTELELRYSILKEAVSDAYDRRKPKYMNKIAKEEFIASLLENTNYIDSAERVLYTQFVSCFSKNGDLLSQWRGYSQENVIHAKIGYLRKLVCPTNDKGVSVKRSDDESVLIEENETKTIEGVSVGFSVSSLEKIISQINNDYYNSELSLGKVIYSKRNQKALFTKVAEDIVKTVRNYVSKNGSLDGFNWNECQIKYHNALISKGAYIKNHFFFEEREWRLCFWGSKDTTLKVIRINGTNARLSNESFCKKRKELVDERNKAEQENNVEKYESCTDEIQTRDSKQYYYLHMEELADSLIKEVIVGPRNDKSLAEVEQLLRENGISCPVRGSSGIGVFVDSKNHK